MTVTEIRHGSAYPHTVEELLPRARALAVRLGGLPSRNRLMRDLRIGANKAAAVLAALTTEPEPSALTDVSGTTTGHARSAAAVPAMTETPTTVPVTAPTETELSAASPAPVETATVVAARGRRVRSWPVLLLALPAFVAIWSGWVGLGGLTGFGTVRPLPGIWDSLALNTAITLPIGMETYAAFALRAWLSPGAPERARRFAKWSAIGALALGAAGQVAYHLMTATGMTAAPWPITTVVACLPVAVLGMGAALAHLLHDTGPGVAQSESEGVTR